MLNRMPDELIIDMFKDEEPSVLAKITSVSQRFNRLANHHSLKLFKHKIENEGHVHSVGEFCLVAKKSDVNNKTGDLYLTPDSPEGKCAPSLPLYRTTYILSSSGLYYVADEERFKPISKNNLIQSDPDVIKFLWEKLKQDQNHRTLTTSDQQIITSKIGSISKEEPLYMIYLTKNKERVQSNTNMRGNYPLELCHLSKEQFNALTSAMKKDTVSVIDTLKSWAKPKYSFGFITQADEYMLQMVKILEQALEQKNQISIQPK